MSADKKVYKKASPQRNNSFLTYANFKENINVNKKGANFR